VKASTVKTLSNVFLYLTLFIWGTVLSYIGCYLMEVRFGTAIPNLIKIGRLVWSSVASLIAMSFYHVSAMEIKNGPADRSR
jgi:hypothetical protein